MNENNYITNAFTKEGENVNLEVNHLTATCITSKNNNFSLDSEGNLTVKTLKAQEVSATIELVRNVMYPVGFIYMSVSPVNPGDLIGGVWEQIKDTFLLASGDVYLNGTSGGEATHKLTVSEMPSHNHQYDIKESVPAGGPMSIPVWANSGTIAPTTRNTGGSLAHNNMPPYLTVMMWKRVQ